MIELFGIKKPKKVKEEEVTEIKSLTIFDYLNDIRVNKKGDIHLEKDPNLSKFDTFLILRFLSLDEGYLSYINVINGFQDILTKHEAYKLLVTTIPRSNKFLKFPKKSTDEVDEEDIRLIAKYFMCSRKQATDFVKLKILSNQDIKKIQEAFGGKHG